MLKCEENSLKVKDCVYNIAVTLIFFSNFSLRFKILVTSIAEGNQFRLPMVINYIQRCHRHLYLLNYSKSLNSPFGKEE